MGFQAAEGRCIGKSFSALTVLLLVSLGLSACNSPEQREAKYLRRGIALFEKGEYAKARLEFRNALAIKPTDAEVFYRLGLTDEAQKDLLNAFGNFVHAEEQHKHYLPAMLKIAEFYMRANHLDEAQQRIDILLSEHPDNAEAHALQAAVLLRRDKLAEAEAEAGKSLGLDAKNEDATSVLADVLMHRNNREAAEAALDRGLGQRPNDIPLLTQKLSIHLYAHENDKAEATLRQLIALRPTQIEFRAKLSEILESEGRLKDAETIWREGVAKAPNDWEMKHNLAIFLDKSGGLASAEKEIKSYIASAPKNDFLYFWLSDLYVEHKARDQAVTLLEQVVERDRFEPEGLNARNSLARIRFAMGDSTLAERLLSVVLEQDPGNHDALMLRASLSYDRQDFTAAVADLRQLLRSFPKDAQAMRLLGETFLRQRRINLAADTLSQVVSIAPDDLSAKVRLAQIYHLSGDNRRAREFLQQITTATPDYPIGWESLARLAIDEKDWNGAETAVAKLEPLPDQKLTATFLRAQIAAGRDMPNEAIRLYQTVITTDPDAPVADHAYVELALAARKQGKLNDAAAFIEGVQSKSQMARLTLGLLYEEQKKTDLAAARLDTLIAEGAPYPEVYLHRAMIFEAAGQTEQSIATLTRAGEILPGNSDLVRALAHTYTGANRYGEAIGVLQAYLARDPSADAVANDLAAIITDHDFANPESLEVARRAADRFQTSSDPHQLDTIAWVYFRQDKIRDALVLMEKIDRLGSMNSSMHYHYGAILLKAGRKDRAKAELSAAVKASSSAPFDQLDDARKLLSQL